MLDTQIMTAGYTPNRRIFRRREKARRRRIAAAVFVGACLAAWVALSGSASTVF